MDEIGQRYLLLALRLGRHLPDMVHAYIGPSGLKELVDGEPLTPPAELHTEALRLLETAESQADGEAGMRRSTFLRGQLTAIGTIARLIGGEEIAFPDRVELLLGCPIEREPDSVLEAAVVAVADLLPGDGSLLERVERHDANLTPARDRVLDEMAAFCGSLRRRSDQEWGLPDGEAVEWAEVNGQPYIAFARYMGNLRTRIELNLDIPLTIPRMLHFAAHEAYPGHHLERATKESLVRDGGTGETMVLVACTPQLLVLEGMAEHALPLSTTEPEIVNELQAAAARNGLHGDVGVDRQVARAREILGRAVVIAAVGRNVDGWSTSATSHYLQEIGLVSAGRADRWARLFDDPIRVMYLLNYPIGASLAGRWLEVVGESDGMRRTLAEQLVPAQLLAEIDEPPALFPESLV